MSIALIRIVKLFRPELIHGDIGKLMVSLVEILLTDDKKISSYE